MKRHHFVIAVAAALFPLATPAQTSDSSGWMPDMADVRGTIGVRFWRTDWSTWYTVYPLEVSYAHAQLETTVTPVASIRYKDFLVSGSYLLEHGFRFPGNTTEAKRKEYDVNLGYFVFPGMAVTLGWKNLTYTNEGLNHYKWVTKGLTAGVSGSAPIAPMVSLYGNVAYGRPKINDRDRYFAGDTRGKYLLTELGLAFPLGQMNSALGGLVVTTGYRYQRVGGMAKGSPYEVFEYTQGPVLGITYSM